MIEQDVRQFMDHRPCGQPFSAFSRGSSMSQRANWNMILFSLLNWYAVSLY